MKNTLSLFIVIAVFSACATHRASMMPTYSLMMNRNYEAAMAELDKSDLAKSKSDSFLYFADMGVILQLLGRYAESNEYFEKAERRAEELYAVSISQQAASLLTSDKVISYEGEDFERVMVNYYKALNYLMMGNLEEALVECRQIDNKLNVYNSKYEKKNLYKEDAFARYLLALMNEADGEVNDAFIDYRKSLGIYENDFTANYRVHAPPYIGADLLRTSKSLGFDEDFEKYKEQFRDVEYKPAQDTGELVLIFNNGMAAHKEEYNVAAVVPIDGYILRVAFPKYVMNQPEISHAVVEIGGKKEATHLAENISGIAVKNLEDRVGRIMAKTIARAVTKYLASKGAEELGRKAGGKLAGKLAGFMVNVVGVATEAADTRSWLTLPDNIQIARVSLPPGDYEARLSFYSYGGGAVESAVVPVKITKNKKTFITYRTFR